jgi:hypothetical protein
MTAVTQSIQAANRKGRAGRDALIYNQCFYSSHALILMLMLVLMLITLMTVHVV